MDNTAFNLMHVVRLREGIKQVVREAERINLGAINSMIKARMVGKQAMGFSVSAAELRRFAHQLNAIMERLGNEIRQEVKNTAALLVNAKMMRYHRLAVARTGQRAHQLQQAILQKEGESAQFAAAAREGRNRLKLSLRQAGRICQIGLAVTRSSKIESTYGGSMAGQLRQVSDPIEAQIENLYATVKEMASER